MAKVEEKQILSTLCVRPTLCVCVGYLNMLVELFHVVS